MAEVKQPTESKAPTTTPNGYGVAAGVGDRLNCFGLLKNVPSLASGPALGVKMRPDFKRRSNPWMKM
jgi:hypothetical protein